MAFVNERSEIPSKNRTVDYERDAVLTRGSESIKYYRQSDSDAFTLTWMGEKIEFGTRYKIETFNEGTPQRTALMTRYIEKCVYPEHLRPHKAEIIQLVLDSMQTYGVSFGKLDNAEVIVKIMPSLGNLQLEPLHELPQSPQLSKNIH
jgi:hypothetical protein